MKKLYTNQKSWSVLFAMCSAFVLLFSTGVNAQTAFGPFSSAAAVDLTPVDGNYDGTLSSMASSSITVSGVTGDQIVEISADLTMQHTWIGDMVIKLENPDGDILTLMSRAGTAETVDDGTGGFGTGTDWTGETVTFIDGGATDAELLVGPPSGTYFPSPGATVESATSFSDFFAGTVNGTWTLYVGDGGGGDNGSIDAWALNIVSASPVLEVFKTVALEDGDGDCSNDAAPPLFQSSLEVNVGDEVCYFYTGFNTGDVDFTLHDLEDDVLGVLAAALPFDLDTGTGVFFAVGPVVITETVTNTATWDAYNIVPGDGASGTATAVVTIIGDAPTNDNVCDAIALSPGQFLNPGGNSANATAEGGEPVPPAGTVDGAGGVGCESQDGWCSGELGVQNSVWFTFMAPASGSVTINTDGSYDTQLAVYEAASCADVLSGGATLLAANDDNPAFAFTEFSSLVDVNCLIPGETYFIQVDGFAGASGDLIIELIENPGEAVSASISGGGLSCNGGTDLVDIIFNFTGTGPWTIDFEVEDNTGLGTGQFTGLTDGQNIPGDGALGELTVTLLSVTDEATGCTAPATGSVVVTPGDAPTAAFTSFQDPAGLTVDFTDASTGSVDTWSWDFDGDAIEDATTQNGSFTFPSSGSYTTALTVSNACGSDQALVTTVVTQPVVVNDDACDALPIACGDALDGSTNFADFDASVTSAGRGVWYVFEGNGQDVTFSTCDAATFDTEITVQTGADCNSLTTFDANDDGLGCTGFTSELTIYAEFGTTYYVHVAHFSTTAGTTGDFTLSATCACPTIDAGTLTADATPVCLTGGTATLSGTEGTTPTVPAGYEIAYVLTDADSPNLDIVDVNLPPAAQPSFDVTAGGNYIIHTLVFNPADGATILGQTTGVGVAGLIGAGTICGALDVTGTGSITVNAPDAGTLTADASSVCLTGGTATLSATAGTAPTVPAGYEVAYVLTDADSPNLDILDVVLPPAAVASFDVTAGGNYIIHTLVFDPADGATILGETTGVGVAGLIGAGTICASLDVTGTGAISVNAPDAGTLTADATPVCLTGGTATLSATVGTSPTVPAGYEVAYVLTDADSPNLDILDVNLPPAAVASFDVTAGGNYIIHTLVFDPADGATILGETTGVGVAGLIGAGTICASLDVAGTGAITVNAPDAGTLTADATPVCLDGGTATISATAGTAPTVPAGYEVAYVLTDADSPNLDILDVVLPPAAVASFDVTAAGNYIIHTLVFDPADGATILGETTGVGVAGLIGAGTICASLDVAGTGTIVVEVCPDAPANDLCGDAITITCGGTVTGSTVDATDTDDLADVVGPGVWYVFAGTGDNVTVSTDNAGTDYDTRIGYTDGCGNAGLGFDDDGGTGLTSSLSFTTAIGTDYYIYVGGFTDFSNVTATGNFELTVTCTTPLANDDCQGAEMLAVGTSCVSTSGTVDGATESLSGCAGFANDDVWFSFVADATTATVDVTGGSDFDAVFEVFDACGGTSLACVDATLEGELETTDLTGLTPGNTYYVRVYHWYTALTTTPTFDICVYNVVTGINEALDNSLNVYPNPSNGEFVVEISGVEADVQLNVLDLAGRVVYTEAAVLNGNFRKGINLDVATGTYLLQIATEEGLVTRKLQVH